MIRTFFFLLVIALGHAAFGQYSGGNSTDRNLFFLENQGRDLGSFAAYSESLQWGVASSGLSYGRDLGVRRADFSACAPLGNAVGMVAQYNQFGNTNFIQSSFGIAVSLRLGAHAGIAAGGMCERQRFSDVYGSATSFAGVVSLYSRWGRKGYFLGSAYMPFLAPNSVYDKRAWVLFSYGYRFDKQLLLTGAVRLEDSLKFGCSLVYSPAARIQLALGSVNSSERLFGQIGFKLNKSCWIRQTTLFQSAWGNSYEIGFYYGAAN